MKKYIAVAICSIAVILWVAFIWSNSAKTGEESGEMSSQVQEVIVEVSEALDIDVPTTEHTVRKGAHFLEYAVLGALIGVDIILICALFLRGKFWLEVLKICVSLPVVFSVALIDEFVIQRATEGRGPSFTDVLIDMSGALLATVCVVLILALMRYLAFRRLSKPIDSRENH